MEDSENKEQNIDYSEFYSEPSLWDKTKTVITDLRERLHLSGRLLLIVGLGLAALVVGLVVLNMFIKPAIEKTGQQGVGGVQLQKPVIEEIAILPRTENTASIVVHLRNPTKGYGLATVPYAFTTFKADGEALARGTGKTYLLPEEDKFLVIASPAGVPAKVDFRINEEGLEYARPFLDPDTKLELVNVEGKSNRDSFVVSGSASNRTAYTFYTYEVTVLLRDFSGKIQAAMSTQLEDSKPGDLKNFTLTWPKQMPNNSVIDARITANKMSKVNYDLYSEGGSDSGDIR